MSDDIVVVDNGSTYETQESAIVAKNEADRAEQWAKYSEEKANLADERAVDAAESSDAAAQAATAAIEAKQYAETAITDENLIIVATDLKSDPSNIKKTAGSIDNVNTVVNDIENINAVAANKVNIDKVAAVKDNIATVATNIVNVNTVAKNIDNVNLLAPHTEAMEALAPDIMDVVTVAGITEQTKNVSENMAHVVAVDNNKANIDKAVANATNITTVATSINNVNAVAGNKANIDNVAANKTNINNVSANITAVNNVSENMADVKNAVQSAADAQKWAIGTIDERPEGSSKYWAEQAKSVAQISDASESVKGIVRLATSDEVTAGTNDSAAITPLKLKQKIAQDLTNPSADTVPSTKAVKDESSRLESSWATSLNGKMNKDASNITSSAKSTISGWGMPSGRFIDLTLGASGTTYTAPANGWFIISGKSTANGGYCILDTNNYEPTYMTTNMSGYYDRGFMPVRKGQVMTLRYGNYEIEADRFKFIYAQGEQ